MLGSASSLSALSPLNCLIYLLVHYPNRKHIRREYVTVELTGQGVGWSRPGGPDMQPVPHSLPGPPVHQIRQSEVYKGARLQVL